MLKFFPSCCFECPIKFDAPSAERSCMARYKPQSRRSPQPSAARPVLRFLSVFVLFVSIGYASWLIVDYFNSTTVVASVDHSFSADPVQPISPRPARRPLIPSSILNFAEPAPGNMAPPGEIRSSDFTRSFTRLDQALRKHGKTDPDGIFAAANARAADGRADVRPCPIAWNDGEPSLSLNEAGALGSSLPLILDRCTSAIEGLR